MKTQIITAMIIFSNSLFAQQAPAQETQNMMRDKTKRKEMLNTEAAKTANQRAEQLVGAENMDALYDISADFFEVLEKEGKSDPKEMQQMLAEFQKNPEAFYNKVSPATKQKLKQLTERMGSKSVGTRP